MEGLHRLVQPMLASLRRELPKDDDRYGWEFKRDGVRAFAYVIVALRAGRPDFGLLQTRGVTPGGGPGCRISAWTKARSSATRT